MRISSDLNGIMLLISINMYVVASFIDISTTYWGVIITKRFIETNPYVLEIIHDQAIYIWYVKDVWFITYVTLLSILYHIMMVRLSMRFPNFKGFKVMAEKYWMIPLLIAILRFLPGIHNLILMIAS